MSNITIVKAKILSGKKNVDGLPCWEVYYYRP